MKFLGFDGYLCLATEAMQATQLLIEGINKIPGLYVIGKPPATTFGVGSKALNVYAIGDKMKQRGWHIDSQHLPPSLHFTVSPMHLKEVEPCLKDLGEAALEVMAMKPEDVSGDAAVYGMIGSMPDRSQAREVTTQYFNDLYKTG
jgi:sphinganine-1-phosphate aldolase